MSDRSDQLTRRQVELILRRTAELERRGGEALDHVTPADLENIAAELGMSKEALRQALAEEKAGLLDADEARTLVDRLFGTKTIEARRFVPGELAHVRASVERFFESQGFEIKRNLGEVTIWQASRDMWTRIRLAFRSRGYRLPRDVDIEVRIARIPGGPHPVLVRLRADATRLRSSRVSGAAVGLVGGAAVAAVGAALLPMPVEILTYAVGAGAGLGGAFGARSSYRGARERLQTALDRFLDFLEHEPQPPPGLPRPRDPLQRLVDFLSADWWR